MLNLCVGYYMGEGEINSYIRRINEVDLNATLMSDVVYVIIENEQGEKEFIFGVLSNVRIHENNPMEMPRQIILKGKSYVIVMTCKESTGIFIETPEHIFMMLDIIRANEKQGIQAVRKQLDKYCNINHIQNQIHNYILK